MYLAIDIGGTDIKYAIISNELIIIEQSIVPTAKENQKIEITKQIDHIVSDCSKMFNLQGVGISSAGVVNSHLGEIIYAGPTMPSYLGTNLKKLIIERHQLPTFILNDVNAAAMGEKWLGNAKNYSNFLCMTIGTGIGGAVVIKDQLYFGQHFRAGEIGHSPFMKYDNKSYEQVASMSALLQKAKDELHFLGDGKQLFTDAKQGEVSKIELIDNWLHDLVEGMLPFLCLLDLEAIIIGGAVSRQGDYLINKIEDKLIKLRSPSIIMPAIHAASLGNDAALFGAIKTLYDMKNHNHNEH